MTLRRVCVMVLYLFFSFEGDGSQRILSLYMSYYFSIYSLSVVW